MRRFATRTVFEVTDLTNFLACGRLHQLELAVLEEEKSRPKLETREVFFSGLVKEQERAYLKGVRAQGLSFEKIVYGRTEAEVLAAVDATRAAMTKGTHVIKGATFYTQNFLGRAPLLLRVEVPSALGSYSYEVADVTIARRAKARTLTQMCAYSEQLAEAQGLFPTHAHLLAGSGTQESFLLLPRMKNYLEQKDRFLQVVDAPEEAYYPEPVKQCAVCPWFELCNAQRRADDHLSFVANIQQAQRAALVQAGVTTLAQLGTSVSEASLVPGVAKPALHTLRIQAALQLQERTTGKLAYQLRTDQAAVLARATLPDPEPADLYFDVEASAFAAEQRGLVYLFGLLEIAQEQEDFRTLWAHDEVAEKRLLKEFVDLLTERVRKHPRMHVYHYASFEQVVLRQLAAKYEYLETEVRALLSSGIFIDLYQKVQALVQVSAESYSLKQIEPFYLPSPREEQMQKALDSVIAYQQYCKTEDESILERIREYNRADCRSLVGLASWLRQLRAESEQTRIGTLKSNQLTKEPA